MSANNLIYALHISLCRISVLRIFFFYSDVYPFRLLKVVPQKRENCDVSRNIFNIIRAYPFVVISKGMKLYIASVEPLALHLGYESLDLLPTSARGPIYIVEFPAARQVVSDNYLSQCPAANCFATTFIPANVLCPAGACSNVHAPAKH